MSSSKPGVPVVTTTGGTPPVVVEKKVAIVGFTASRSQAPFGQPGWEIWLCNNLWKFAPNDWHRLYDLHDVKTIEEDREHEAFLSGQPQKRLDGTTVALGDREVYTWDPKPEWPTAVAFPKAKVNEFFGRYFNNSISWMIAHAIAENATELHIYGVDMATGTEYASQRPSCEYFLGMAVGMGIKVHVPNESDLLKVTAMYGAEDDSALHAKILEREGELVERLGQTNQSLNNAQLQAAQLQGALETTRYFKTVWTNPRGTRTVEDEQMHGNGDGELPAEVLEQIEEEVASGV